MIPKSAKMRVLVTCEDGLFFVESKEFGIFAHGIPLEAAVADFWEHLGITYQHYVINYPEEKFSGKAITLRKHLIEVFGYPENTSDNKK